MNFQKGTILAALIILLVLAACTPSTPQVGASPALGDVLDQEWKLVSYGAPGAQTPAPSGANITLKFETSGRAAGNAGCNSFGGEYQVDGDRLSLSNLASTLMACADPVVMDAESEYLRALAAAETYQLAENRLQIAYDGGTGLLVFEK